MSTELFSLAHAQLMWFYEKQLILEKEKQRLDFIDGLFLVSKSCIKSIMMAIYQLSSSLTI